MPSTTSASPCQLKTSTPTSDEKKMKMPDPPEYVVYTDSELDLVRAQYFALLRSGKERGFKMSKELCCRLIRNTITSMVAILRASPMGKEASYPSKLEMKVMSQKIIEYYPMLRDTDPNMPHVSIVFFILFSLKKYIYLPSISFVMSKMSPATSSNPPPCVCALNTALAIYLDCALGL